MSIISFLFDDEILTEGYTCYIPWYYYTYPHLLVTGATGSGKTYAVKLLLGKIGMYLPNASITVCDYKADDFKFLRGKKNYYEFEKCSEGLQEFYQSFLNRQQGIDESREFKALVFDEFASFLNNLDKKQADEAKKIVASILMLGRSFNVHIIISVQRADANFFPSGGRDNFSIIIAMGNISKEAKEMLFKEFKDDMKADRSQGTGYMLIDGVGLKSIRVPFVTNAERLESFIKKAVDRL